MTSHWPTFADGKFWCACDNRTFDSEEEWQAHVVESSPLGVAVRAVDWEEVVSGLFCWDAEFSTSLDESQEVYDLVSSVQAVAAAIQPSESSSGHAAPSR